MYQQLYKRTPKSFIAEKAGKRHLHVWFPRPNLLTPKGKEVWCKDNNKYYGGYYPFEREMIYRLR